MIKVSLKRGGGLWVSKTDIEQVIMELSDTISISELSCRTLNVLNKFTHRSTSQMKVYACTMH